MPYSSLTDYLGNSHSIPPIVVFDKKVYARNIESRVKTIVKSYGGFGNNQLMRNYMKACWAYFLNRGPDALELHLNPCGFTAIVVDDLKGDVPSECTDNPYGKGYWRNIVGHEYGLPPYKGGRKPKDEVMMMAMETGYEYLDERGDIPLISEELFEADDIAGELTRMKKAGKAKDRMMYLSTLDGDWQVLVDAGVSNKGNIDSDSHNIVWVNTRPFNDRVRGNAEVIDYYERKERVTLSHPSEVSKLKNIIGDAGDNLFTGAGLRLFTLLMEDPEYKLSVKTKNKVKKGMTDKTNHCKLDHLNKAADYIMSIGHILPETMNPSITQYEAWRSRQTIPKKGYMDFAELYKDHEHLFDENHLVKKPF